MTDVRSAETVSESSCSGVGTAVGAEICPSKAGPAEVLPIAGSAPAGGQLPSMYRSIAKELRLYAQNLMQQARFLDSQARAIEKARDNEYV